MRRGRVHKAMREHEVAYQDLLALVNKHADMLSSLELLAIAANMVGKLIAMQDQRSVSPDMALAVVSTNIEMGNADVLRRFSQSAGNA